MDHVGKDDVPISILATSTELSSGATSHVGFTGDYDNYNEAKQEHLSRLRQLLHVYGCGKGWIPKKLSSIRNLKFGVANPHDKVVQRWNQFIVISCLFAIFIDPLFFYLLSVEKEQKCIVINWPMTKTIVFFRSIIDLIYLFHILVQFRLAFISPESRVVGVGDLVKHPKRIAMHYLHGFFILDLFIVLPLPQIIILLILPSSIASFRDPFVKNLLQVAVLIQYVPRLYRFLPLLASQSPRGFLFESVWANFVINLLTFVLAGHIVGSCWYLFGLQRVNQCFREACHKSGIVDCMEFIDCGRGNDFGRFEADLRWNNWKDNENSSACFSEDGFPYGIYMKAVNLTLEPNIVKRYVYSFFWGFQQISTLAGNQSPSYFMWEVLFTMCIIWLGLLLFALLIAKMQNFLQALGRRRMEWLLKRREIEEWINHRHLPQELQRKVILSERYNWSATQGFNEDILMKNFPEDLQRDIRRYIFYSAMEKVGNFELREEPLLDAIIDKLRLKTYSKGGIILHQGYFVTKMSFILRGKMSSVRKDGKKFQLNEGYVCGEELLIWRLQRFLQGDLKDHRKPEYGVSSKRTVICLTNVEAFVLRAADLEEVIALFPGSLNNHDLQTAIRKLSPYWRAATTIQVAWKYWKKRHSRLGNSRNHYSDDMEIEEETAK